MGEFSDCEAQLLHEMALFSQILLVLCTPFKIVRENKYCTNQNPRESCPQSKKGILKGYRYLIRRFVVSVSYTHLTLPTKLEV